MGSFLRTILIIIFILGQLLVRAQSNLCLQKTELLQLQASELTDVTLIMRSKNWTFDGAKEWANASEQSSNVVNQVVSWKSSLGTEMFFYFDNGDRPNFAIAFLSEPCYNSLLSLFNNEQQGLTSIQQGMLLTTFFVGSVNVEFLEGAKKEEYQVRLYAIDDKEIFMVFIDNNKYGSGTKTGTGQQGDPNGSINGRGVLGGGGSAGTGGGNGTGNGVGSGSGSGMSWKLDGRSIINTPKVNGTAPDEGTVMVDIWVDSNGNVTKAIANAAKSNTSNGTLFKMAEDAARKAKFDGSPSGNEQKGSIKIPFRLN